MSYSQLFIYLTMIMMKGLISCLNFIVDMFKNVKLRFKLH